jgi:hypothetical protein
MPELSSLRELSGEFRGPQFDELVAVSRQRRRRSALALATGAAAIVVAVGIAGTALSGANRTHTPIPQPSPSPTGTPSTADGWAPERTVAEGEPVGFLGSGPSDVRAQLYCIGDPIASGSPCDRYHPYDPAEEQHWALEVAQGEQSAVFEVLGTPVAKDFDEQTILVQDGTQGATRLRLLRTDGTEVLLREVDDLAAAIPGPGVVLIGDLGVYRSGMAGPNDPPDRPYLVDVEGGTLQRLDVPAQIAWWGPNVDEFLWGGSGCRVIWQQPDGTFDHHDIECRLPAQVSADVVWEYWSGFDDWAGRGRMALLEHTAAGTPRAVHASLDYGDTWHRVEVEPRDWGETIHVIGAAIGDILRQLE